MVRTVREHYVWCIAEGTPPINISLFNASTLLASGIGTVTSRLNLEGNYTCVARNDAGTDSRHFQVSFIGKGKEDLLYTKFYTIKHYLYNNRDLYFFPVSKALFTSFQAKYFFIGSQIPGGG